MHLVGMRSARRGRKSNIGLKPAKLFGPLDMLQTGSKEARLTVPRSTGFQGGNLGSATLRSLNPCTTSHGPNHRFALTQPALLIGSLNMSPKFSVVSRDTVRRMKPMTNSRLTAGCRFPFHLIRNWPSKTQKFLTWTLQPCQKRDVSTNDMVTMPFV